MPRDNERWLLEAGALVIDKKISHGMGSWTRWERLVYCLWITDYGMRNAGDLKTAEDVHAVFKSDASQLAEELSLTLTHQLFSLPPHEIEINYFDAFERVCGEIRDAEPRPAP